MGSKRSADAIDTTAYRSRRPPFKRLKLTPTADDSISTSPPSSCSVSEDSALQSSLPKSDHTRHSSMSSLQDASQDEVSEISNDSGESSSDSDSLSDDDEDEMVTIGGPKKPLMSHATIASGVCDLKSRLDALLPQMATANERLSSEQCVSMEDVEDGDQYIEMNLGLGVLEHKSDGDSDIGSDDTSESEASEEEEAETHIVLDPAHQKSDNREFNVMSKLMGQRPPRGKIGIEDIA